VIFLVIWS